MESELLKKLNEFRERLHKIAAQNSAGNHKKVETRFDRWRELFEHWLAGNFEHKEIAALRKELEKAGMI